MEFPKELKELCKKIHFDNNGSLQEENHFDEWLGELVWDYYDDELVTKDNWESYNEQLFEILCEDVAQEYGLNNEYDKPTWYIKD